MQTGEASVKSHLYDNGTLPILYSEITVFPRCLAFLKSGLRSDGVSFLFNVHRRNLSPPFNNFKGARLAMPRDGERAVNPE